MGRRRLRILRERDDLARLFRRRYQVFFGELHVAAESSLQEYRDEWDDVAVNVVAEEDDEILGGGRLIFNPGSLGFRVSTSLDLGEYFADISTLGEISGLFVLPQCRHEGIGHAIHWARLEIARALNLQAVIASAYPETAAHLRHLGFVLLNAEFSYTRYPAERSFSQFLSFDLLSEASWNSLLQALSERLGWTSLESVQADLEEETHREFNYLPIRAEDTPGPKEPD